MADEPAEAFEGEGARVAFEDGGDFAFDVGANLSAEEVVFGVFRVELDPLEEDRVSEASHGLFVSREELFFRIEKFQGH